MLLRERSGTSVRCRRPHAHEKTPRPRGTRRSSLQQTQPSGNRIDRDLRPLAVVALELHHSVDQREERVVATLADVATRVELRAALPHQDVARRDLLATIALYRSEERRVGHGGW